MHRHRRHRGKTFFEVLCALGLAASFASAWDEIGTPSLLASASIMALFAIYWSFGLFARDRTIAAAEPTATVVAIPVAEVEPALPEPMFASEPEVFAVPERVEPEPVKRRPRKAKKAAAAVVSAVEQPEPLAVAEPVYDGPPLEQLFDAQPFVRQARPAFGKKARGPRPVAVG